MGAYKPLQRTPQNTLTSAIPLLSFPRLHPSRSLLAPKHTADGPTSIAQYGAPVTGAHLEQAARFGHSFDRISILPPERKDTTDLPSPLKTGIEHLSGLSMHDVQIHFNSSKPAELEALAFTQGTDIHVGPGQENHLAHEAWHVVQQKQGRVKPTLQAKGLAINDEQGLEREADVMGNRAQKAVNPHSDNSTAGLTRSSADPLRRVRSRQIGSAQSVVQRGSKLSRPATRDLEAEAASRIGLTKKKFLEIRDSRKIAPKDLKDERYWKNELRKADREVQNQVVPRALINELPEETNQRMTELFRRFNALAFRYTGGRKAPEVGWLAKEGDCGTLAQMFKQAAEVVGIADLAVVGDAGRRLVDHRPIHGRTTQGNVKGNTHWHFGDHSWCTWNGHVYDVLFMQTGLVPSHAFVADATHNGVAYSQFAGSLYMISRGAVQDTDYGKIASEGIVFTNIDSCIKWINKHTKRMGTSV